MEKAHFSVMGWGSEEHKGVNKELREAKGKMLKKEKAISTVQWFTIQREKYN